MDLLSHLFTTFNYLTCHFRDRQLNDEQLLNYTDSTGVIVNIENSNNNHNNTHRASITKKGNRDSSTRVTQYNES